MKLKIKIKKIPEKLKIKGNNLIQFGKNSQSETNLLFVDINIALFQNVVPRPINISFNKYPENTLKIDSINKGINIEYEDS